MFPVFLARKLGRLEPLLANPVNKRAASMDNITAHKPDIKETLKVLVDMMMSEQVL